MVFLIYIRNTCLAVKAEKIFLCLLKIENNDQIKEILVKFMY